MAWPNKKIQGQVFSFGHLNPLSLVVTPKAEGASPYRVRVTYSCHVFTRSRTDSDRPDLWVPDDDGTPRRSFCHERYNHSLNLEQLISWGIKRSAYFGEKRNFLFFDEGIENGPYVVFFDVVKARNDPDHDVMMLVRSAHLKPKLPARSKLKKIGFTTLVAKTFKGEKVWK